MCAYRFMWRLISSAGRWSRPTSLPFSRRRRYTDFAFSRLPRGVSLALSVVLRRYILRGVLFFCVLYLSTVGRPCIFISLLGLFSIRLRNYAAFSQAEVAYGRKLF